MEIKEELWEELKRIPEGQVTTYKELAKRLKSHPRAIAKMLSVNPHPIIVPCHRVVKSNGEIGGYTHKGKQNVKMKIRLLKGEGVEVNDGKVLLS